MTFIEGRSMTKREILDAALALGYQFSTDDPFDSLGVILYGKNPKFKTATANSVFRSHPTLQR
jgi:hypothetical protein